MKKPESQKTNFITSGVSNGAAQPTAPSTFGNRAGGQTNADPSSSFRSSRYPVPQFEHRTQVAR